MIECVVAILLIVILVAGMLQFVELAGRKGELLAEIRGEAGRLALGGRQALGARPDYILDWSEGADATRHTADDESRLGLAGGTLQVGVVNRSVRHPDDWRLLDAARNTAFPLLHDSSLPLGTLGFVHAEQHDTLPLMPAMRDWLLGRDTVTVGADLWFPTLQLEGF
jgi:hypothetical protein